MTSDNREFSGVSPVNGFFLNEQRLNHERESIYQAQKLHHEDGVHALFIDPYLLSATLIDDCVASDTDWISLLVDQPSHDVMMAGLSQQPDPFFSIRVFVDLDELVLDAAAAIRQTVVVNEEFYSLFTGCVLFEHLGYVRLVRAISGDFDVTLISNRLDWSPKRILNLYLSINS